MPFEAFFWEVFRLDPPQTILKGFVSCFGLVRLCGFGRPGVLGSRSDGDCGECLSGRQSLEVSGDPTVGELTTWLGLFCLVWDKGPH